jgi:hypothetical protein
MAACGDEWSHAAIGVICDHAGAAGLGSSRRVDVRQWRSPMLQDDNSSLKSTIIWTIAALAVVAAIAVLTQAS